MHPDFGGTAKGLMKLSHDGVKFKGWLEDRELEFSYTLQDRRVVKTTKLKIAGGQGYMLCKILWGGGGGGR